MSDRTAIFDPSTLEVVCTGLGFSEGPIAMPDGTVLLVDIKNQCLTRARPGGACEVVAKIPGGPNGAAIGPDGRVYICNNGGFEWAEVDGMTVPGLQPDNYIGGRIQRVDLDT